MNLNIKSQDKILRMIDDKCKFVPLDGVCPVCGKNIFKIIKITEDLPLITSCPFCQASFVD